MDTQTASPKQPHWREVLPDLSRRLVADRILVASDFDGTLSRIAATPEEAVPVAGACEVLHRLSELPGVTVAVISGRALADIQQKTGLSEIIHAGNHGLEMQGPGMPPLTLFTPDVREEMEAALAYLKSTLGGVSGVLIEDKGASLSVHYRQVAPVLFDAVAAAAAEAMAKGSQLQLRHGKMVWELRPNVAWNKGSAVVRLLARFKIASTAAFFAGDDETDQDVYGVLPRGATFAVGGDGGKGASFCCHSPEDVVSLLEWLAEERTASRRRLRMG